MNLPLELFLSTIALLDLEELMNASAVSRSWRQRFTSPDVSLAIIKKHFRTTWENSYNSLMGRDQELAADSLCRALPGAIAKRLRRQHYKCRQWESPNGWNPRKLDSCSISEEPQYNNGAVAFQLDRRTIGVKIIDRSGPTRPVRDPDRAEIFRWILSDQYLITATAAT